VGAGTVVRGGSGALRSRRIDDVRILDGVNEEMPPDEQHDDGPDDEQLPDETPSEEQPGAFSAHRDLPPYWSELFNNISKIDLPQIPKIDLPRVPKFDVPYMPKIDLPKINLPKFEMSAALADEIARISERVRVALASVADPIERLTVQLPRIPTMPQHVVDTLKEAGRVAAEAWERGMPRNWKEFEFEEIEATIARVRATGFSLAWLPRTDVLRDVLAAPEGDTAVVLLAHREELIVDLNECLGEITVEQYTQERDAAVAAVAAFADGHPLAAQALAASVLTSALHVAFEDRRIGRIGRKLAETDPEDAVISQLRLRTIYLAARQALGEFHPATAEPERLEFNRHNTAHRITAAQWTEANALSALMLVSSLLRELDFWDELGQEHGAV